MFRKNYCVQPGTVRDKEEAPKLTGVERSTAASNYSLLFSRTSLLTDTCLMSNGRGLLPSTYWIRDGSDKVQGL